MKTICDKCDKYNVSQCGTRETCNAIFDGSKHIISMDKIYVEGRMTGEKNHCKSFKKISS
jgi:hypothetical protein